MQLFNFFSASPGALTPYRCKPAGCVTRSRCALPGSLRHSGLPDALLPRGEAVGVRGLCAARSVSAPSRPGQRSPLGESQPRRGGAADLADTGDRGLVRLHPPSGATAAPLVRPRPRFAQRSRLNTSRRAASANCGPMSGVPTCRLCWLREHATAAA